MNKGSTGLLGFVLIMTLFGSSGSRSGIPSQSRDGPRKAATASTRNSESESLPCMSNDCMIQRHTQFICGSEASPNPVCTSDKESDGGTQFMIATLPDPTRTHLALFFDRLVDALEQGIQDSGYLFERSHMPWDPREHPESDDIVQRIAGDEYQRSTETWPGIMIFRRAPGQPVQRDPSCKRDCAKYPTHIVVLIAGEFPTGGIHKEQFRNAITLIQNLAPPESGRLLILGPTFSGSLAGLPDLVSYALAILANNLTSAFHAYAFSGTVSSRKSTDALWSVKDNPVRFASFQQNDEYILEAIEEYVNQLGFDIDKEKAENRYLIAVLSEDETAYGSQGTEPTADYLQLYFPREISQLRSAYQGITSEQVSSSKQPSLTLPLNFERTGGEEDTVATFSSRQLPISQESVLLGLVNELRANHVRFVVLRATDPMDFLFLARYLRSAYPQGRIITLGSDLLFARETQDSRLFGIVAATVYPQVPRLVNHSKIKDVKTHRIFPSSFSTGLYNATLALLQLGTEGEVKQVGTTAPALTNAAPESLLLPASTKLYHYDWYRLGTITTPAIEVPPVHLTALGHNGYWPLYVSQPVAKDHNAKSTLPLHSAPEQFEQDQPRKIPDVTEEWKIFQVLVLVLTAFLIVCFWKASVLSHENLYSEFSRGREDHRSGVIATLGFAVILLLQIALWPDWSQQVASPWYLKYSAIILMFMLTATVSLDILCRKRHLWLAAFLIGIVASTGTVFYRAAPTNVLEEGYVMRSVHLVSGLSPVLPVILLLSSVIWATWQTIAGTSLLDERLPKLPACRWSYAVAGTVIESETRTFAATASGNGGTGGGKAQAAPDAEGVKASTANNPEAVERPSNNQEALKSVDMLLADENRNLLSLIKPTLFHPRIDLILASIGIAGFVLIDHDHPLSTLESRFYCHLVAALGGLCALTLVGMTWRMWLLWKETKLLLISLDSRTIRRAFVKIGGISAKPFQIGTNSEGDFSRLVSRAYEAVRCVTNRGIIPSAEIVQTLAVLWEKREATENALANKKPRAHLSLLENRRRARGKFKRLLAKAKAKLREHHRPPLLTLRILRKAMIETGQRVLGHFGGDQELIEAFGMFQKAMANAVAETLLFLIPRWNTATVPVLDEASDDSSKKSGHTRNDIDDPVRVAEHFVCTHYVNFILIVMVRIRAFMTAIVGMYVLLVLAFSVYPFEPSLVLRTLMAILLIFIVGIAALVYGGMHRDVTLSHITDTIPGELGMDFWLRMVSFVALPLFSLTAAAFPEFNRFLFSWLEPALQALK